MTSNIEKLHPKVIQWLYLQGWKNLHEIQEKAIQPIIAGKDDIIISAATASGKTEAAFLPACTSIMNNPNDGIQILYISPLKALINDQYKRIEHLGKFLNINVTPWHGDINQSLKTKIFDKPSGIVLITPESLESLLINHKEWCAKSLRNIKYLIIDEFHAFIGTERGYQLLSQMHRLEVMFNTRITRIALSATLSNIESVKQWLRPNSNTDIYTIASNDNSKGIKLQIRGYKQKQSNNESDNTNDCNKIAEDIFKLLRGSTNLVFANSRAKTEYIATLLSKISQQNNLPEEFFPHHSSLSKDLRERLENRLKENRLPTTAICTQTLELGIDIGDVTSIAQVNAPQSVASLRQRIGRSGRRNKDAILRLFISEIEPTNYDKNEFCNQLCDQTFLSTAMIELVLERWFEPPTKHEYALSTLIQQTLSVIAQYGSVKAKQLWLLLCKTGPFNLVTQDLYVKILKSIGQHDLITQMRDGSLTLGLSGEKLVSNYNFFSSFKAQEEYSIDNNGNKIGTIPLNQPLNIGDTFLFAGNGWEVVFINNDKHQISVKPYKKETYPLVMDGTSGKIHDAIREKMFTLYTQVNIPKYLDATAKEHFILGRDKFLKLNLDKNKYIDVANGIYLFPWKGDKIMNTLVQIFKLKGITAKKQGSYIFIPHLSLFSFKNTITDIVYGQKPTVTELSATVANLEYEKYDSFLSKELLCIGYGYRNFDVDGAMQFLESIK